MLVYLGKKGRDRAKRVKEATLASIGWLERDLEDLLAGNMHLVFPEEDLMLLGTQRPRQEDADILALDAKGVLHVFELKRRDATAESLLQVLRYGQRFGRYGYERLDKMYQRGGEREKSLQEAHQEYFDLDEPLEKTGFNKAQQFVVVAEGTDHDTWEAVRYWRSQGLRMHLVLYRVHLVGEDQQAVLDIDPYVVSLDTMPASAVSTGYYVLNSNRTYDSKAYKRMLDKGRASAYGSKKHVVERLKPGDRTYLYHTGTGLIAVGTVQGNPEYADWDSGVAMEKDGELYVSTSWEWVADPVDDLSRVIPARVINEAWESGHRFRQTLFSISEEQADVLDSLLAGANV